MSKTVLGMLDEAKLLHLEVVYVCRFIGFEEVYNERGYHAMVDRIIDYMRVAFGDNFELPDRDLVNKCIASASFFIGRAESLPHFNEELTIAYKLSDIYNQHQASVKREALMKVAGIEEQDYLVDNRRRAM